MSETTATYLLGSLAAERYQFIDRFGDVIRTPAGAVKARHRGTGTEVPVRVVVAHHGVVEFGDEIIVLAPVGRHDSVDAAEAWGFIYGRYKDRWPDLCESLGLQAYGFSLLSLEAVLDLLMERLPQ